MRPIVESRREILSVADCRKPLGASGRHGGDDWFSRPVVARIFTPKKVTSDKWRVT